MAFAVKDWKNLPNTSTPLSEAALEDLETRLSTYSDSIGGGIELGYAAITTNATNASTTAANVAGLTTTVPVGTRPIMIAFSCGASSNTASSGGVGINIMEDGAQVGGYSSLFNTASNGTGIYRIIRRSPGVGAHTYNIQLKTLITGTATITCDTGGVVGPAFIQVTQT